MKLLYLFVRIGITCAVSLITWLVLFFGYDQLFWYSTVLALSGGAIVFCGLQLYSHFTFLKTQQLTRNEYAYIRKNLREAKGKIKRLRKMYLQVRSIGAFRQVLTINRLVKRIYSIVKREPKRFYQADQFFFYHLDSMVELMEKHTFLAAQQIKDKKLYQSLKETRRMIDELIRTIEEDLYKLVSTDMDQLTFELEVAKHSLTTRVHPLNERRTENDRAK